MWPVPRPDEAHFADIALALLHEGRIATDLFGQAIPGMQLHSYWTPPLYYVLLAGWFGIFGASLFVQRAFSTFCAGAALAAVWRLAGARCDPWRGALVVGLVLADVTFLHGALVGRMDMLCLAMSLWAVYWATRAETIHKDEFVAGFLAGLAVCAHPLGLIAVVGVALWCPRWKALAGGLVPVALWVAWVLAGSPTDFVAQWDLQLGRKTGSEYEIWRVLRRFMDQYLPVSWAPLVLWLAGMIGAARSWRLFVLLACAWVLSVSGGEMWYCIWLVPLSALGVALLLSRPVRAIVSATFMVGSLVSLRFHIEEAPEIPDFWRQIPPNTYHLTGNPLPDPYWFVPPGVRLIYPSPIIEGLLDRQVTP